MADFFKSFNAPAPVFNPDRDRYDMGTWGGRAAYFFDIFSPKLIPRQSMDVDRSKALLKDFADGKITEKDAAVDPKLNQSLWDARCLVESVTHDDGSIVPWYGRFSWFVPLNVPIVGGMIMYPIGAPQYIWQWINQSYNVIVNYSNSNKSAGGTGALMQSYFFACSASVGIAAALSPLARKYRALSIVVPYTAVACAGAANIMFTRSAEMKKGVRVWYGPTGRSDLSTEIGMSPNAGTEAVTKTALTRVIMPIPTLLLPPILMACLDKTALMRQRWVNVVTQLTIVGVCLWIALPVSVAMFPRFTTVLEPGKLLEADLQTRLAAVQKAAKPRADNVVWYNRGM